MIQMSLVICRPGVITDLLIHFQVIRKVVRCL